ncbi:MAG TPA: helix-turn-helix transcriptional regulator [Planctomycetota bacterium]|nr:helix-turn-helix transcriptional regulator [Planctomycetota bacterium]
MLPLVKEVVYLERVSTNAPGAIREGRHAEHVISCHIRARGTYILGRERLEVAGPYMLLLGGGELDGNGLVGQIEQYWCVFEWAGVRGGPGACVTLLGDDPPLSRSHLRQLQPRELSGVVKRFQELQRLWRTPGLPARLQSGAIVLELLALWAQPAAHERGERKLAVAYRNAIDQFAFRADVSLAMIAARIGFSSDYLASVFRAELGVTPVEYRTRVRLRLARELLTSTLLPIAEIARQSGFPDPKYFSRAFRAEFGSSPRHYASQTLLRRTE